MKHALFLRWWLFISIVIVASAFAGVLGVFSDIWEKDATKLSFLIFAIFGFMSLWCGLKTFVLSHTIHSLPYDKVYYMGKLEKVAGQEEIGWFSSEMCLNIGMIGTVIGFIMMLVGFAHVDVSNVKSVQDLLGSMSGGMSTALYTTLVGLICSQLLKIQYFHLMKGIEAAEAKADLLSEYEFKKASGINEAPEETII